MKWHLILLMVPKSGVHLLRLVVGLRLTDVRVVFNVLIHREHARPWCFRRVHKTCQTCWGRDMCIFNTEQSTFCCSSATAWTASVHTLTHAQTCNVTRVQSATQWTASVHTLTHAQTCNVTRVQSATEWTASVHILHMSKPVMKSVFKVLRNGLFWYISYTSKPVMQPVFKVLRNGLLRYISYTCPNL